MADGRLRRQSRPFRRFMVKALAPGALKSGPHDIDVTRLNDLPVHILAALDYVENWGLAWLEMAPRTVEFNPEEGKHE